MSPLRGALHAEHQNGGVTVVKGLCNGVDIFEKHEHSVTVPTLGFVHWQAGSLIQHAMPSVSADDREFLVSGTCGPCFDKAFKDPEDA